MTRIYRYIPEFDLGEAKRKMHITVSLFSPLFSSFSLPSSFIDRDRESVFLLSFLSEVPLEKFLSYGEKEEKVKIR